MSLLTFPPYSPLPLLEQYIHPFVPTLPSLLGQVKPAFKLTLNTVELNLFL